MADDLEFDYDIGGGQRKAAEENIEQEEEEEEEGDAGANDESALRAALHFHVGEICSAESEGKAMTGGAVSTLAEVVFRYSEALALDLRVFAKHGKRAVVGVDDIKCVARKDPKLVDALAQFEAVHLGGGKKKANRKKKPTDEVGKGATSGATSAAKHGTTASGRGATAAANGNQSVCGGGGGYSRSDNYVDLLSNERGNAGVGLGKGRILAEGGGNGMGDGSDDDFLL